MDLQKIYSETEHLMKKSLDRLHSDFSAVRTGRASPALLDHVRATAGTTFHPTSTCMMGPQANAVVDTSLRVRGVERLRVIDASIMPTVVSGNTNATAIMIGEKGADMILHAA